MDRRDERARQVLLEKIKAGIARRLAHVCAHLSDAETDALIERMAHVEIKYAKRRVRDDLPTEVVGESDTRPRRDAR